MRVAAGALLALMLVSGCSSGEDSAPKQFTVDGAVILPGPPGTAGDVGGPCGGGAFGRPEIGEGATVTILDASGKKVALGELGEGVADEITCKLPFKVTSVPDGGDVYTVKIGDSVDHDFKRSEADDVGVVVGLD